MQNTAGFNLVFIKVTTREKRNRDIGFPEFCLNLECLEMTECTGTETK